jgi:hypothetical protein
MKLRSWLRRSVPACATISLLAGSCLASTPALALVDAADATQWQAVVKDAAWRIITAGGSDNPDARVEGLAAAVEQAIQNGADPARIYLVGRGAAAAAVFYTISRVPDLWAAAIAIDGSPEPAMETGRIFAANFTMVPLLWASQAAGDQGLAANLKNMGMNLEWRSTAGLSDRAVLEWLAQHRREPFPSQIDCETNTPSFARCYWIQLTKFDAGERNDMLRSTRLQSGSGAALALGAFGYRAAEGGPGVLVAGLPDGYSGPLKTGDRIVALDGRPVENAHAYIEMMGKYTEEKPVVAMIQRGKGRIRMETRILVPPREAMVTARVQAQFVPADREIQIVSRTATEMRVTIPPAWAMDTKLFWNGLALEKIDGPGCVVLTEEKELLHAARCP